ncbi:hypothetical protein ACIPSA_18155 [Streptomyces sp. NPDC086549]|uniref:hypothetical protein n=1 Tax=Streptomyces sp. NPDC086549 TaxID=3365752 RepID=UPI00382EAEFD
MSPPPARATANSAPRTSRWRAVLPDGAGSLTAVAGALSAAVKADANTSPGRRTPRAVTRSAWAPGTTVVERWYDIGDPGSAQRGC